MIGKIIAACAVVATFAACGERGTQESKLATAASRSPHSEGFVLPPYEPGDCEHASGEFLSTPPPASFGAVVGDESGTGASNVDAVLVSVVPSEKDRELADDEESIARREVVGGRRVRTQTIEDDLITDWYEDGWLATVRYESSRMQLAQQVVQGLQLPRRGGSAADVELEPPPGAKIVASESEPVSEGYVLNALGCRVGAEAFPDVTVTVHFFRDSVDPRAYFGFPGRTLREEGDGREYWRSAEHDQIVWREGSAIVSIVGREIRQSLTRFAKDMKRVSRNDVVEWFASAGKEMQSS